jgi:hypothetical protein
VVVTAKKGTELPFDVKDIPTILWEFMTNLAKTFAAGSSL